MQRRFHFLSALAGGVVAALVVTALPAIAQDAEPQAAPGSPFLLGQTNTVQANTGLRGTSTSNLVVRNTGNGVPLNLITAGNGKPPMKVDSRRLVRNLNADTVDFRHANELIRAAYDGVTQVFPDPSGDAVTATIVAPKPGYLIMGGSIDARGVQFDDYRCRLNVNGARVFGSTRYSTVNWDSPGTDNGEENCSTDGGFVVDKGTHTVALNVEWDTAHLGAASVWVIWVPFDGQGNVPTPPG